MTHLLRNGAQAGAFAILLMLGACGDDDTPVANDPDMSMNGNGSGGSDGSGSPGTGDPGTPGNPNPPMAGDGTGLPAGATGSNAAFVSYLTGLSAADESGRPADLVNPAALGDETSQPTDI